MLRRIPSSTYNAQGVSAMHICPRELLVASDFGYRWETRRYLPAYLEMMDLAQYFIVCGENSAAGLVGIEMNEQVSDTPRVL